MTDSESLDSLMARVRYLAINYRVRPGQSDDGEGSESEGSEASESDSASLHDGNSTTTSPATTDSGEGNNASIPKIRVSDFLITRLRLPHRIRTRTYAKRGCA